MVPPAASQTPVPFPLPLTPFECYYWCDDRPEYPTTFPVELRFRGALRREPFESALQIARGRHPMLAAWVDVDAHRRPIWVAAGDDTIPLDWADELSPLRSAHEFLDLTREVGLRVWARAGGESGRVVLQFHHACCDAIGALRFIEDVLVAYDALVEGADPATRFRPLQPERLRLRGDYGLSEAGYRPTLRDAFITARVWASYLLRHPARLAAPDADSRATTPRVAGAQEDAQHPQSPQSPSKGTPVPTAPTAPGASSAADRDRVAGAQEDAQHPQSPQSRSEGTPVPTAPTAPGASSAADCDRVAGAQEDAQHPQSPQSPSKGTPVPTAPTAPGARGRATPGSQSPGAPGAADCDVGYLTHCLTGEDAAGLRTVAARHQCTLNDVMLRDLFHTLQEWNEGAWGSGRGRPLRRSSRLTVNVPVDLRLRADRQMPAANMIGFSFIARRSEEIHSDQRLLRSIHEEIDAIRKGRLPLYFLGGLNVAARAPRLMRWVLDRPRSFATICFSNAGRVLTRAPLRRTGPRLVCGNLTLQRVTGVPPIRPHTRAAIAVVTCGPETTVNLRCDPRLFSPEDASVFLNAFVAHLRETARRGHPSGSRER